MFNFTQEEFRIIRALVRIPAGKAWDRIAMRHKDLALRIPRQVSQEDWTKFMEVLSL